MTSKTALLRILDQTSVKVYYIEFQKYFFNHTAHGIVSLARLGATEERLLQYVKWATKDKLPSDAEKAGTKTLVSADNFESFIGQKQNYYGLYDYFNEKLSALGGDAKALVSAEFTALSDGLAGSALHSAIHIGYGLNADSSATVVEGLAFLAFTQTPLRPSKPWQLNGDFSLEEFLQEAREQKELAAWVLEEAAKLVPPFEMSDFGCRMWVLFTKKADVVQSLVERLRIPSSLRQGEGLGPDTAQWLTYVALAAYARSASRNNFFLLHGVTCAWGLQQIFPLLSDAQRLHVSGVFLGTLASAYLAVGAPSLREATPPASGWDILIQQALDEDRDEHDYKILQVAQELSQLQVPEVSNLGALCLSAATDVMKEKFSFY